MTHPGRRASRRLELQRNLDRLRSSGRIRAVTPPPPDGADAPSPDPFQALVPCADHETERLREEVRGLRRLQETIHFLGGASDLRALRREVLDLALSLTRLARGILAVPSADGADPGAAPLQIKACRGFDDPAVRRSRETKVLRGMLRRAFQAGEALIEGNALEGGILGHARTGRLRLGAVVCLPLQANGIVHGALLLDDPDQARTFTATEEELLRTFARHAGLALERLTSARALKRRARGQAMKLERLAAERERLESEHERLESERARLESERDGLRRTLERERELPYARAKRAFTQAYLLEALQAAGGDLRLASERTGLPVARLTGLLRHLGIEPHRASKSSSRRLRSER